MQVWRVLGWVGRALITAGVLILLFVAYQLWGTGLLEARSQDELKDQFEKAIDKPPATSTTAPTGPTTSGPPPTAPPAPPLGDAAAHIVIPHIGVDKIVVEGVAVADLRRGPGHYPGSPMPGQPGNAAIAGHRTTYGAPFNRIDELDHGDEVLVTTSQGSFRYVVDKTEVVSPGDVRVLQNFGDNRLTLTSCNPKYSARQRIVVVAKLAPHVAPAAPAPKKVTTPGGSDDPNANPITGLDAGLSGDSDSWWPAILWGIPCALIWLGAWLVAKRIAYPWLAYVVASPFFFVILFICYEHVERALPANL